MNRVLQGISRSLLPWGYYPASNPHEHREKHQKGITGYLISYNVRGDIGSRKNIYVSRVKGIEVHYPECPNTLSLPEGAPGAGVA